MTAHKDNQDFTTWLTQEVEASPAAQRAHQEARERTRLARTLRKARQVSAHTQATLAGELQVRQSLVSKWESRDHNHTLQTLQTYLSHVNARLVLGVETGDGAFLPISEAAERCMVFSAPTHERLSAQAREHGLTLRECLLELLHENHVLKTRIRRMEAREQTFAAPSRTAEHQEYAQSARASSSALNGYSLAS